MNVKFSTVLDQARQGVDRRGRRIAGGLLGLALWSALGTLGVLGLGLSLGRTLIALAAEGMPGLEVPVWAWALIAALTLLGLLIALWAILRARALILAVRAQTLAPGPESAGRLAREARAVRPWITLGQWTPVVGLLLSLGAVAVTMHFTLESLNAEGVGVESLSLGWGELTLMLLSTALQSLPGLVINGLILAAVRRWLDAVTAQAAGRPAPVLAAARAVDNWFLFTLILLGLDLLGLGLGLLSTAFLPALLGALDVSLSAQEAGWLRTAQGGLVALLLSSLGTFTLLTLLIAWSRGFAADVAQVLGGGVSTPAADPWTGRETIVPPHVDLSS